MKALSMYVWSLLVIMMMGFTSCGDDDELQFSEEQLAYINKNKEYIWEKKAEKDENGELKYKQVVIGGDTAYIGSFRKKMSGQRHLPQPQWFICLIWKENILTGKSFKRNWIDQVFL